MNPRSCVALALVQAPVLAGTAAWAREFPQRPVTTIVPAETAGGSDTTTHPFARSLETELDQPVTVVNQGQGGGVLGLTSIVNIAPDGSTIGSLFPYAECKFIGQVSFSRAGFTPSANFNGDSPTLIVGARSQHQDETARVMSAPGYAK